MIDDKKEKKSGKTAVEPASSIPPITPVVAKPVGNSKGTKTVYFAAPKNEEEK